MWKKILSYGIWILKNWRSVWTKLLTVIGNIKIFKTPCFCIYDPAEFDYMVRGEVIREIEVLLQPGDVVLRGYKHFLDGYLIPGELSHSGIYIGDGKIIHAVAEGVKEVDLIDFFQCDKLAILRPASGQDKAIERVKGWLGRGYDFFFTNESSEFYCHELTASAYKELDIQAYPVKIWKWKLPCLGQKYLAESFLTNKNFTMVIKNV